MYKYKEAKSMEEIHKIRIRFYEEDKDLSSAEKVKRTNKIARRALEKYGLSSNLVNKK